MDLGYFWTDTAFEICRPVNVVIRLFVLGMIWVTWAVLRMIWVFDLGSDMGFGYTCVFRLIRLSRYAVLIRAVSHMSKNVFSS